MFGLPIEIISGLGSYLLSGWLSINKAKSDREDERHRHDMAIMASQHKNTLEWLNAQQKLVKTDPHFSVTRRFIALFTVIVVMGSMLVLPAIFQDVPWILQVKETTDGFLGFFGGTKESYQTITGLLYLDWMGSMVLSIIGFYFGHKAGK